MRFVRAWSAGVVVPGGRGGAERSAVERKGHASVEVAGVSSVSSVVDNALCSVSPFA